MTLQTHAWEHSLLNLAYEAMHTKPTHQQKSTIDENLLEEAYTYCEEITAEHSRSFFLASGLLPKEKRRATRALYAFCRVSDDIVDDLDADEAKIRLSSWEKQVLVPQPKQDDLVALAWSDARLQYQIPHKYAEQLIQGVARDLTQQRYKNFSDLATYAYGVASTVGLMSMHITGFKGQIAVPYAVKLGVALQITNILRDVKEDWLAGRVYLPLDEIEAFGLIEDDLDRGFVDDRWRAFMRFQIQRNRRLYAEAWPGIALLDPDGRFAIGAAARLYEGILADIEQNDYDVFNRRAHVTKWGKLAMLPKIWWQTR